jgi:hypothetical protein
MVGLQGHVDELFTTTFAENIPQTIISNLLQERR